MNDFANMSPEIFRRERLGQAAASPPVSNSPCGLRLPDKWRYSRQGKLRGMHGKG